MKNSHPAVSSKLSPSNRRWALLLALAALVGITLFVIRPFEKNVPEPPKAVPTDERLVWLDSNSILLNPQDLGRQMTEWFDESQAQTLAFELSDQSFAGDTADLSALGQGRVGEIAELMNAHTDITAVIERPIRAPTSRAQELYGERADKWNEAIAALGVDPSRLAVVDKEQTDPTARSSQLVVKLVKP